MRLGFALPQVGHLADPDAVAAVAARGEALGFDSFWVLDRLLWPLAPKAPYPPTPDGSLPVQYRRVLDPLDTLTFAAAKTTRAMLGTSVLNLPWYNPTLLARRLTTIDVLSKGRLRVGVGVGWSPDEYEAAGARFTARGRTADEHLRALKSIWMTDPVAFEGTGYRIAPSANDLRPVQKPYPPIYMAAFVPAAMKRAAEEADGWFPVGIPLQGIAGMFESMLAMRGPGPHARPFELIVRGNVLLDPRFSTDSRADFTGSLEEVARDIATARQLGVHELVLDVQFSPDVRSASDLLQRMEQLRAAAG
jgi:probable F420-dependent oxidoreductase